MRRCRYCHGWALDLLAHEPNCVMRPLPGARPVDADCDAVRVFVKEQTGVDVTVEVVDGRFVITDPAGQQMDTGLVRLQ